MLFFAAGDQLVKLDRKLLFRKSREATFVEINKKKIGEDTVITLLRNPTPGLAFQDKVMSHIFILRKDIGMGGWSMKWQFSLTLCSGNVLRDNMGMTIFDLQGCGGC